MIATLETRFPLAQAISALRRTWSARPAATPVPATRAARTRELARNAVEPLPAARGEVVDCLAGCLWITFDDDPRDVVVEAGQSYLVDSDGACWVQALAASRLRVSPGVAPGLR